MNRKCEELSLSEVREYLRRGHVEAEDLVGIVAEVSNLSWYVAHRADPQDEGYRAAALELIQGAARAEAAAMGKDLQVIEASKESARQRESPLAFVLSAEARLDPRVAEFLAQAEWLASISGLVVEERLRLIAAHELLQSPMIPQLMELLARQTLSISLDREVDLRHASLAAAWSLLRTPIKDRLPSLGRIQVISVDGAQEKIPYFVQSGTLERLDRLVNDLSADYGLGYADLPALVLSGKPGRLREAVARVDTHMRFGSLNEIVMTVPAHVGPSEVAALYARARVTEQRPRGLGRKGIALVRSWAVRCLRGEDPHDYKGMLADWNDSTNDLEGWLFEQPYRFNNALSLALRRILKPTAAEEARRRKAAKNLKDADVDL